MVKLEISIGGIIGWMKDDCGWYYCMKFGNRNPEFFIDSGKELYNCKSKAEYYRLIKMKLLW